MDSAPLLLFLLILAFLLTLAYLLGSISSAILVCRLYRLPDPRLQGSHNPGATNVYRIGGTLPALLTLLGDSLKGVLPVLAAKALAASPTMQALVAGAAILGHMLPLFFRFQGGKGVATCLGAGLVMAWPTTVALTVLWVLLVAVFRISSIASLGIALLAAPLAYLIDPAYWPGFLLLGGLILARHRENVVNLLQGRERTVSRLKGE